MQLHIREGVVLAPAIARRARGGFPLLAKLLHPKYVQGDGRGDQLMFSPT
jgi:hypothetical protein